MSVEVKLPDGYRLIAFDSLDSTNERARELAADGEADGAVVWARVQTAGRGRQGRQWQSPAGNLYCSILLRPGMAPGEAAQFSFVTALALGAAVSGLLPAGADLRYKWPNDLLVGGRKAAGILLEASGVSGGKVDWLVVGAGLNLAHHPDIAPGSGFRATSLAAEGAAEATVEEVLGRFVEAFARWRVQWRDAGLAAVHTAWLARAWRLGEEIAVRQAGGELRGRFEGLDGSGALLLALADGSRRALPAGDVYF